MFKRFFTVSAIILSFFINGTNSPKSQPAEVACLAPEMGHEQVDETSQLAGTIMDAIIESAKEPYELDEIIYKGPEADILDPDTQQFLFFLKPNATVMDFSKPEIRRNNPVLEALKMIKDCGIPFDINEIRVFSGKAIARRQLVTKHYGAIGFRATRGRATMEEFRHQLKDAYNINIDEFAIYGGVEILGKKFDGASSPITSDDLVLLWSVDGFDDTRENGLGGHSTKIAPGTYFIARTDKTINGKPVILVNGFHPLQIEQYCEPENKVVVTFSLSFDKSKVNIRHLKKRYNITSKNVTGSLQIIRDWIIGFTKPDKAYPGSFRRYTYDNWKALGMVARPDMGDNSAHFSAGPIEGMRELCLWTGIDIKDSAMGQLLLERGLSTNFIRFLMESEPRLYSKDRKYEPIFDATEGMDVSEETVNFILNNRTMPQIWADYIAKSFSQPQTREHRQSELEIVADMAVAMETDQVLAGTIVKAMRILRHDYKHEYGRLYNVLAWCKLEHISAPEYLINSAA